MTHKKAATAKDTAAIYDVFQRTAKLQLPDFVEIMETRPVPPAVLDWMKGMGEEVNDKKALARSRGRRNASKKKRTAEEAALKDKDRTNDFGLWYAHIKDKAERYFNDIITGKALDILKEPGAVAPWEKEEALYQDIQKLLSANTSPDAIITQKLPEIAKLQQTAIDLKIRALLTRLDTGAYFTALHRNFVETGKMTRAALAASLQQDPTTIDKYRNVYAFLKEHNLFVYTGETLNTLARWLTPLKDYLARSPQTALYWQGKGLNYAQQRVPPTQFKSANDQFQVCGQVYPYSTLNLDGRVTNEQKALDSQMKDIGLEDSSESDDGKT